MSALFSQATGSEIRVRFCPSPTGTPHVGLIRTALFNWAYAKHTGGTFVFRIEDTDPERDTEESYQQILEALRWLGLTWDEGVEKGGPHAPYRQSERMDIYRDVWGKLLEAGHLYESYITHEEMVARNEQLGRDKELGYDNHERELTDAQRQAYRDEGRSPALRLRVPEGPLDFDDLVRGPISFPSGSTVDFVVVRPNGFPLYTFVNPVDDALMGITHALRGEDLLSSTPRQIALHHALIDIGFSTHIPRYGHLPYVMGEGNKKLSKRDPESNLFHHRDRGFIPEGLLNYLALLGWSIGPDRDVFTLEEMTSAFDIVDVNPNPARFDLKKAEAINADHLRALDPAEFGRRALPYLQQAGVLGDTLSDTQTRAMDALMPLVQTRVNVLSEVAEMVAFAFTPDDELTHTEEALATLGPDSTSVLADASASLSRLESWDAQSLEHTLRDVLVEKRGIAPRHAFTPVRVAISGRRVSPPLFESMEVIGRESSLARLEKLRRSL